MVHSEKINYVRTLFFLKQQIHSKQFSKRFNGCNGDGSCAPIFRYARQMITFVSKIDLNYHKNMYMQFLRKKEIAS